MKKRILCVAAHPDDEVIGCGGSLARFAEEGTEVFIAILGEGSTSRYNTRDVAPEDILKELHQQCNLAGELIGAKEVFLHNLPDNRFDTVPLLEISKMVERLLDEIKPQTVFTHHAGDLNIDHAVTFRAVLTAARPVPHCPVREVYSFEIASSTEWSFGHLPKPFQPSTFIDISATVDKKIAAMELYHSEVRPFPHPRSAETLRANAQRWGSIAGCDAAEAFELIRSLQ